MNALNVRIVSRMIVCENHLTFGIYKRIFILMCIETHIGASDVYILFDVHTDIHTRWYKRGFWCGFTVWCSRKEKKTFVYYPRARVCVYICMCMAVFFLLHFPNVDCSVCYIIESKIESISSNIFIRVILSFFLYSYIFPCSIYFSHGFSFYLNRL